MTQIEQTKQDAKQGTPEAVKPYRGQQGHPMLPQLYKGFIPVVGRSMVAMMADLEALVLIDKDQTELKAVSDALRLDESFDKQFGEVTEHLVIVARMIGLTIKTMELAPLKNLSAEVIEREKARLRSAESFGFFAAITMDEAWFEKWINVRKLAISDAADKLDNGAASQGVQECVQMLTGFEKWHQGDAAKSLRAMGHDAVQERLASCTDTLNVYTGKVVELADAMDDAAKSGTGVDEGSGAVH